MIRERDETSFLQEAHIARRVLDTFAQDLTMNEHTLDLDQKREQFCFRFSFPPTKKLKESTFEFMSLESYWEVSKCNHFIYF